MDVSARPCNDKVTTIKDGFAANNGGIALSPRVTRVLRCFEVSAKVKLARQQVWGRCIRGKI